MKKNIIKSTAIVFSLSLLAKLIGFVKSIIQASYFGTTIYTDAYNVASGFVSNVLYMFATAIAVSFVPIYIQRKQENNQKQFATITVTLFSILSIVFTVFLLFLAPLIVRIIAPSYIGYAKEITIQYFRVLVLGFSFAIATNLYSNLLNSEKIYGFSTFCSIINSMVLITCIVLLADRWGVWVLVVSMPISYCIQLFFLYYKGKKYASLSLKYGLYDSGIKLLAIQALPILISQATVEINQVVDRALLTSVGEGALTSVSYAAVLYQFVTTLVSAPLSTVMFTELSEAATRKNYTVIKNILNDSYKALALFCIPIVMVMYFRPTDIVTIVFAHGKFSGSSISDCAIGLRMYGICLLPVCIKTVLSRAYYAVNDTRRPMIISMMEVSMNIFLSILLVKRYGIVGVVGATAIASLVFIIIMMVDYNKKYIAVFDLNTLLMYWKIGVSTIALGIVMKLINKLFFINPLIDFIVITIISFSFYFILLLLLKEDTLLQIVSYIKKRFSSSTNNS